MLQLSLLHAATVDELGVLALQAGLVSGYSLKLCGRWPGQGAWKKAMRLNILYI